MPDGVTRDILWSAQLKFAFAWNLKADFTTRTKEIVLSNLLTAQPADQTRFIEFVDELE